MYLGVIGEAYSYLKAGALKKTLYLESDAAAGPDSTAALSGGGEDGGGGTGGGGGGTGGAPNPNPKTDAPAWCRLGGGGGGGTTGPTFAFS